MVLRVDTRGNLFSDQTVLLCSVRYRHHVLACKRFTVSEPVVLSYERWSV